MKETFLFISFFLFSIQSIFAESPLQFSGEVKTKWITSIEDAKNEYKIKTEASLQMDYLKEEAWFSTKVKASCNDFKDSNFSLERAFLGVHLFEMEDLSLDLQAGRNRMDSLFDSKVQYDSYFNGILLTYNFNIPDILNFTMQAGPHMVNSSKNRIGAVAEMKWKNISGIPLDFIYSMTHWGNFSENKHKYAISHVIFKYDFGFLNTYIGHLNNHRAQRLSNGVYFGCGRGSIKRAYDYSLDANVQYTKRNAVPSHDFCGIGKGIQLKGAFAITDALIMQCKASYDVKKPKTIVEFSAAYIW